MINQKIRALIREMVEDHFRALALDEGRKIAGYEVDDLSFAERDELESFVSGYVDRERIESRKVRNLVAAGPSTRTRRDTDDVSSIKNRPVDPATMPASNKPTIPGKSVGEVSGWHESLKPTGRFGGNKNKETGDWMRFQVREKQADAHWVWTGKRWVSNIDFARLNKMGYLPER
jgi:hypothetical protein